MNDKLELENYENYLHDLGYVIKEEALNAKKEISMDDKEKDYKTGYMMGFHRVISLMQQYAKLFDIPLKKNALRDIDPYKDLL